MWCIRLYNQLISMIFKRYDIRLVWSFRQKTFDNWKMKQTKRNTTTWIHSHSTTRCCHAHMLYVWNSVIVSFLNEDRKKETFFNCKFHVLWTSHWTCFISFSSKALSWNENNNNNTKFIYFRSLRTISKQISHTLHKYRIMLMCIQLSELMQSAIEIS